MKQILMVSRKLQHPSLLKLLEDRFQVFRLWEDPHLKNNIESLAVSVDGIVTEGFADKGLIDSFPRAKIIASFGVGFDGVDVEYASAKQIQVTNTPDVLTDDVADMALMLLLATSRGLCMGDRLIRQGRFEDGFLRLTRHVYGKCIGILGMGRIGQAIARRAEAFRLKVVYHGPREKPGLVYPYHPDLLEMASSTDFLVVSCTGGAETRHLVNRQVIEALGPEGILVNIARGSVVEENAMVELLQKGKLGGAGLDVFENAPHVPEAMFSMDNVVLQPHRGSATVQTRIAMGQLLINNLETFFAGRPVPSPVNVLN